ncbi:MAG TPA: hypothetical protein VII11_09500, partial [Bacteroidota bacterium]
KLVVAHDQVVGTDPNFFGIDNTGLCTGFFWYPSADTVTLTIIAGTEVGSFYGSGGALLGNTTNFFVTGVHFVANAGASGIVTVEASIKGVTSSASFSVVPVGEFQLQLESFVTDVAYGWQADLFATAIRTADGQPVDIDDGVTYSFEIIQGTEWAVLADEEGRIDTALAGVPQFDGFGRVTLQAYVKNPMNSDGEEVVIRVNASDPSIQGGTHTFTILPSGLYVILSDTTLAYGEQTTITVKRRDLATGDTLDLAPWETVVYRIRRAHGAGYLTSPDLSEIGDQLFGQSDQAKFVAAEEEPQPDSVQVFIQVEIEGMEGKIADGTPRQPTSPSVKLGKAGQFYFSDIGLAKVTVKKEAFEILLGESKYYYAEIDPSDPNKLKIKESTEPITTAPAIQAGFTVEPVSTTPTPKMVSTGVRFSNSSTETTEKLGVYWEYKYPVWSGDTFVENEDLPDGVIRLVGRYWEAEKTYRIKLTASASGKEPKDIEIEVKRPSSLGNSRWRARDVFDREINIDDSCIVYGGRLGIPPHFLKAQISIESPSKTFTFSDGKNESGFAPGYRFEPYTTQFSNSIRDLIKKENPFVVLPNSLREPPPPDHNHVLFIDYIKNAPVKVWYFAENYSQLVDPAKPGIFGVRLADGRMDYNTLGYRILQAHFDSMYNYYRNPQGGSLGLPEILSVQVASDSVRKRLIEFLKTKWRGGLDNVMAQTRIAASYGLFQTLYPTGIGRGYPSDVDNLPEGLNVPETVFPLSLGYQVDLLKKKLGSKFDSGDNWPNGFEESFERYVYYPGWNQNASYPGKVFGRLSVYLPKK